MDRVKPTSIKLWPEHQSWLRWHLSRGTFHSASDCFRKLIDFWRKHHTETPVKAAEKQLIKRFDKLALKSLVKAQKALKESGE